MGKSKKKLKFNNTNKFDLRLKKTKKQIKLWKQLQRDLKKDYEYSN